MQINQRLMLQAPPRERGFTLLEVLVAIALLTVGLIGIGLALSAGSGGVVGGSDFGLAAVTRANSYSTATELAQGRIEEIKNATYKIGTDQITQANFPNEAYNVIAGFPGYRRTVTITPDSPALNMKTITVQVFFLPDYQSRKGAEESVRLSTIIAQRP